jgi:hypothetical protein
MAYPETNAPDTSEYSSSSVTCNNLHGNILFHPDLAREPIIYLIPECDTPADVDNVLRELCDEIFPEQLAGWYTDTETWPEDRSFNVFCRWFDYQQHSMLVDLSDEPLIAESD